MKPNFSVAGRVIVITGAAGILCSEMAKALAADGAVVALTDVAVEKAEMIAQGIREEGGKAIAVYADVMDRASLVDACVEIEREYGPIDGLVNGAGGNRAAATVSPDKSFFDIPIEALQGVFDLNVTGTILASQVFARGMVERNCGTIVNVSSISGITPLTNVAGYAAAKAACVNFTRWLGTYVNLAGATSVRVNAIAPGFFLTEQNRFLMLDPNTGAPTPRGQKALDKTPMHRYGNPPELAGVVQFLLSEASSFINGEVITVDGGFLAYTI